MSTKFTRSKAYEELCFIDDFMFTKIMVNNMEICRRVLELILGVKIRKVSVPEKQKEIKILYDGKGIRLDVYVDDDEGTVYNIEMQTILRKDLPKRSRYYQGMIDLHLIEKGAKYQELKRSFVIFICLDDPFGRNLPVYRFENVCLQDKELLLDDEAVKVFVNAEGSTAGVPEEFAAFIRYLKSGIVESELVGMIEAGVEEARSHEEWRLEYMTLFLRDQENRDIGREEGLKEGREEGLKEGRKEGEGRMKKLTSILLKERRTEELEKALADEEYCNRLYEEYGIL